MAGGTEPHDDPSLKGMERYFNSKTIKGRANVAMATYGFFVALFLIRKITKPKPCPKA